jgi:choline monooxygenase
MESELIKRIESYNDKALLEEAFTIPASWYVDAEIAALEARTVFSKSWQMVGRVDQVAEVGQYFTAELAGEPIVVVRDESGVLRAFYNVCRHHAAAVVTQPCGKAEMFRCPYHGWKYGLDGSLKGAPEFAGVCNFDRSANGLVPISVAVWEHFVFVRLDGDGPTLEAFLGHMLQDVAQLNLKALSFYARREYVLHCNWKVFVDNYLDGGYHVPHIHQALNSVLDYSQYTIENGEHYSLQSSPMVRPEEDAVMAAARKGDRAYYYWIYPNLMINIYEGVMDTNLVLPLGTDKCVVFFDFFFSDTSERAEAQNAESVRVSDRVQDEDVAICESVQRGLRSRAYKAGRLSVRREAGEHLFHRLLAKDLRAGL